MHAVSVSGLKNHPAEALRQAKDDLVVVLNRDQPDAVLIGLDQHGRLQAPRVRSALASCRWCGPPGWPGWMGPGSSPTPAHLAEQRSRPDPGAA